MASICVVFAMAAVAACGDDGGGGDGPDADDTEDVDAEAPPDAAGPVTFAEVCGEDGAYVQLVDKLVACNPAFDLLLLQGRGTPVRLAALCNGALGPYIEDGSIAVPERAALEACLAYIDDTACASFELAGTPCEAIFAGQVADAGDCEIHEQCGESSYCDGATAEACGACAPRVADEETCALDEQCLSGVCVRNYCAPIRDTGEQCADDEDCLGPRTCEVPEGGGFGTCSELVTWTAGDTCVVDSGDCDPFGAGLWCDGGLCEALLEEGQPCRVAGVAQGACDFRDYLTCPAGSNEVCTAPSTVPNEGGTCGMFNGARCADGMYCSTPLFNGVCTVYQAEGETCDVSEPAPTDQCDAFLTCVDDGTPTCEYGTYSGSCPAP